MPQDPIQLPSEENIISVSDPGYHGRFGIKITQQSQNPEANTTDVRVYATLYNDNDWTVWHTAEDIERHIAGSGSWYPDPFSFGIGAHLEWVIISHVFTVTHNVNGTKTVSFTAHYGLTDTPTFNGDKSVTVSMVLTPLPVIHGLWIRIGGRWKRAVPYVRSGGKWKQAVPYVRNGGTWKITT